MFHLLNLRLLTVEPHTRYNKHKKIFIHSKEKHFMKHFTDLHSEVLKHYKLFSFEQEISFLLSFLQKFEKLMQLPAFGKTLKL